MPWLRIVKAVLFLLAFAAALCVATPLVPGFGVATGPIPSNGTSSLNQSSTTQVYFSALRGDASAVAILRYRASGGDAVAEALLGNYYLSHRNARAFTWLSKATAQHCTIGKDAAQSWLGECYFEGLGTKQNYLTAEKWFRVAAGAGNAFAAYELGLMRENGTGMSKNLTKALHWFQTAASDGQPNVTKAASSHIQYISVILAEKSIRKGLYGRAVVLLKAPAAQGSPTAEYLLGNLYARFSARPGGSLSPIQIKNAWRTALAGKRALEKLTQYARAGDMNAQYGLYYFYSHVGPEKLAVYWLEKEAHFRANLSTGNLAAQYDLVTNYLLPSTSGSIGQFGQFGIPWRIVAHADAHLLLSSAAHRGYDNAEYLLGRLYLGYPYKPFAVRPNRKKAKFWLEKAAAQGDKRAIGTLKIMARGGFPAPVGLPSELIKMFTPP